MTPHETALVTILLERLKKTVGPDKDPEAEALIRQTTVEHPDAAYHLVQTVLIQDWSLHVAQIRIVELEKGLAEASASFLPPDLLGGLPTPNKPVPNPGNPAHISSGVLLGSALPPLVPGVRHRTQLMEPDRVATV